MKVVFLTGAGISKDAGIPTFEEVYGSVYTEELTERQRVAKLNKEANKLCDWLKTQDLQPTALHKVIADLRYDVTVFTQNVDCLHEKAGSEVVHHIHGTTDNPVYFDGIPRRLKEFREKLANTDILVVIGTQLHYAYLSEPITWWAFNHPGKMLVLDPRDTHSLDVFNDCRCVDPTIYPKLLVDWLDIQDKLVFRWRKND